MISYFDFSSLCLVFSRELVKHEFIIPLVNDNLRFPAKRTRQPTPAEDDLANHLSHSVMKSRGGSICLQQVTAELNFPADELKCHAMNQIDDALQQSAMYRRDLDDQARVDLFV